MSARRLLLGCFFTRSIELEGVGSLASGLAEGFVAAGWEVDLLLPEGNYPAIAGAELHTFQTGAGGLKRYRARIAQLSRPGGAALLIENNPNLARSADASTCPGRTWPMFVTPLQTMGVLKELGLGRQGLVHAITKHRLWSRLIRWPGRRVLVASQFQAQQLRALGADRVEVLPVCGVSASRQIPDRAAARRALGWDDRPVVGYLGHYSRAKGVDVLVEAFSGLPGESVLAIGYSGKGRLRPENSARLDEIARAGRLRLLGRTDPTTFLAACDAVALPYITSSIFHQPQVMLESFAAATAVITSDLGGFGELVQPRQTGLLCPPRNPAALRAAIEQMLSDLPAAHRMGLAGREVFAQRLSREVFCSRFQELTEED